MLLLPILPGEEPFKKIAKPVNEPTRSRPSDVAERPQRRSEVEVSEPEQGAPEIDGPPTRTQYSTAGLCTWLTSLDAATTNNNVAIVDDCLRLTIVLVDQHIGEPQNRGKLINVLRKDGAFLKRSKKYFYLNATSEAVKPCLQDLSFQK